MRTLVAAVAAVFMFGMAVSGAAQSGADAMAEDAMTDDSFAMKGDDRSLDEQYGEGCKAGEADNCWKLGLYYKGQYDMAEKSRAQFLANCAKKEPRSCYMLAGMANQGDGGPRDEGQARTAYGKACELGLAFACSSQAGMLASGDGGREDKALAAKTYARGCELGSAAACADAAALFTYESDKPYYDPAKAKAHYTRSCDLGMAASCASLASIVASGDDTTASNPAAAQKLYQKACMAGDSYACDNWLNGQLDGT